MTRAERLAALADLARYRSSDLLRIVGRVEHTSALINWLQEEADEAAADEQVCPHEMAGFVRSKLVAILIPLALGLLLGLVPFIEGRL
ncbi:MAG: hypothetical protein R6W92_14860 [Desulfocurvibacter africanus]